MAVSAKKVGKAALRVILRTLLVLFTVVLIVAGALMFALNMIFNGPSPAARDVLTMSLSESSAMKWVPAVFLGEELVAEIRADVVLPMPEEVSDGSGVVVNPPVATDDEWKDYPDGIRIEEVHGENYNAYVMMIRDPSRVYLATSTEKYTTAIDGTRIHNEIVRQGAVAAINGGAFNDDGTTGSYIGSLPIGLTVSGGEIKWDDGKSWMGFAGFNEDDVLVVAKTMSASQAKELNIRDGCCFGPVLIVNGVVNDAEFSGNSGFNPRTAIGQRADGVVLFVCIDGRQAGSLGGTYADIINIMVEYGAVNACNLDGGASSTMLYKDTEGRYDGSSNTRYGEDIVMINNYAILQEMPRKMPTFFMVRPEESEE